MSHHLWKHELSKLLKNYYNSTPHDKLKFCTKGKLLDIVKQQNHEENLIQNAKERNLNHYYEILKVELLNYLIENFSTLNGCIWKKIYLTKSFIKIHNYSE